MAASVSGVGIGAGSVSFSVSAAPILDQKIANLTRNKIKALRTCIAFGVVAAGLAISAVVFLNPYLGKLAVISTFVSIYFFKRHSNMEMRINILCDYKAFNQAYSELNALQSDLSRTYSENARALIAAIDRFCATAKAEHFDWLTVDLELQKKNLNTLLRAASSSEALPEDMEDLDNDLKAQIERLKTTTIPTMKTSMDQFVAGMKI